MPPHQHNITPEDKSVKKSPRAGEPAAQPRSAMPPIQRDMDVARMPPSQILSLQRSMGNRAVQQLVSSSRNAPVIQTKLQVGPVGDRYEQEADRIAAQVVKMPTTPPQTAQRESEETIQRMESNEEEEEELG